MVWAPDSPDLWAPDSATPHRWAPDSGGHPTLGRAVDLFLAAKAAEGAAAKTLEWYGMILRRAVRGLGEDRPIEQLAGPDLRAWILELRATLSPISVAGHLADQGTASGSQSRALERRPSCLHRSREGHTAGSIVRGCG
jgi:hypothetical protein